MTVQVPWYWKRQTAMWRTGYELNNDPGGRDILKASFGTGMDRFVAESLDFYIQFDGQEIFKRAINGMGKLSAQVLEKCGLDKEEVDWVIPHQANERIIDTLVHRMKIPKEKAFVNIANYGNTSAAPFLLPSVMRWKKA